MFLLIEETSGASLRPRAHACNQPTFPSALLRLIQQEFNKIFRQALERRHRVRWSNFEILRRALATGNFRPDLVTLSGGMAPPERPLTPPSPTRRLTATPQEAGNTLKPQGQGRRGNQVQENNPYPAPKMKVGPGFRIRTAIDTLAADGVDTPQTDNGRQF